MNAGGRRTPVRAALRQNNKRTNYGEHSTAVDSTRRRAMADAKTLPRNAAGQRSHDNRMNLYGKGPELAATRRRTAKLVHRRTESAGARAPSGTVAAARCSRISQPDKLRGWTNGEHRQESNCAAYSAGKASTEISLGCGRYTAHAIAEEDRPAAHGRRLGVTGPNQRADRKVGRSGI
jgi:hypothetical protein